MIAIEASTVVTTSEKGITIKSAPGGKFLEVVLFYLT